MLSLANQISLRSRILTAVIITFLASAVCLVAMPVRPAQASVVWTANPTKPMLEEWANVAAEPGRITSVPFASVPYGQAYRVEIREGDDPGGYGERDELAMGNPERSGVPVFHEGEDVWIAFQFRMQSPYPISEEHYYWNLIMQLHQLGGSGVPPFAINVEDNKFMALTSTGNEVHGSQAVGAWPAEVDKWSKFLLHVKFSPNPEVGSIEIFGELNEDKSGIVPLLKNTKTQTMMVQNGVTVPTHARLGTYRGYWSPRPTAVTYYAGFTIATDRASAEATAFDPTSESSAEPPAETPNSGTETPSKSGTESTEAPSKGGTESPKAESPKAPPASSGSGSSTGSQQGSGGAKPPAPSQPGRRTYAYHYVPITWRYISSVPRQTGWSAASVGRTDASAAAAGRADVTRIYGRVASSRARHRQVTVDVYRDNAWRPLAARRVDSRGRFSLSTLLPAGASKLRAYVAGIGWSRAVPVTV